MTGSKFPYNSSGEPIALITNGEPILWLFTRITFPEQVIAVEKTTL